jgi:hypothetical protein
MHQGKVRHVTVNEVQALRRLQDIVRAAMDGDERTKLALMRDVQWIVEKVLSAS